MLSVIGAVARPAGAALPCQSPVADPCVINSSTTVPVGVYDIRPRSLVINASKTITLSGTGLFEVLANNVTLSPGAKIINASTGPNVTVTLMADGTIALQSQGTSKSKIDVSGTDGGNINLYAAGSVSVIGALTANATNQFGAGGAILVHSTTGSITVGGDPSEGIRAAGDAAGGGGAVVLEALLGSVSVTTQLAPKGGDCSGCQVDITAGLDVTTTVPGIIDMTPSFAGDGGILDIEAGRDVLIQGKITASGTAGTLDEGGGSGGDLTIDAGGTLTVNARVEIDGAAPDGSGGSWDVSAVGDIVHSGGIFARSVTFGQSDGLSWDSRGNITLSTEVAADADVLGGDMDVTADGLVTVSGDLHSNVPIDPVNNPDGFGGTIDIESCQISIPSGGIVTATGAGGGDAGSNFLFASTGMTIAGHVTATSENLLTWRTSAPVLTGSTIVPAPIIVQDPALPCCGVSCPVTTTTTTVLGTTTTSTTHTTTTTTATGSTASLTTTTSTSTTSTTKTTTTTTTSTTKTTTTTTSTTTTTTTTSTTTSTTLPSGCSAAPLAGCFGGAKASVIVNEKSFGRENLKIVIDHVTAALAQGNFGNPVTGSTAYTVCLYDQTNVLVDVLKVDRAGALCAGKACWRALTTVGYKYTDKFFTASGVQQINVKSGAGVAGKGKLMLKGKNDLPHGYTALPTHVAKRLLGSRSATAQILTSDAGCFTATVPTVTQADGILFKGSLP